MDEIAISRAIIESYTSELLEFTDMDVAIVGAGPSGLVAGYYLGRRGVKAAIFERRLSIGGGMWGGGMMFNRIVVQAEARDILDEIGITAREYQKGYYVADSVEAVSTLCSRTVKAGTRIFNLITAEDVMIREDDRITGLVLNWSAVSLAKLHVDPLVMRSKLVIDATGHAAEICHIVVNKLGARLRTETGNVVGEYSHTPAGHTVDLSGAGGITAKFKMQKFDGGKWLATLYQGNAPSGIGGSPRFTFKGAAAGTYTAGGAVNNDGRFGGTASGTAK